MVLFKYSLALTAKNFQGFFNPMKLTMNFQGVSAAQIRETHGQSVQKHFFTNLAVHFMT